MSNEVTPTSQPSLSRACVTRVGGCGWLMCAQETDPFVSLYQICDSAPPPPALYSCRILLGAPHPHPGLRV